MRLKVKIPTITNLATNASLNAKKMRSKVKYLILLTKLLKQLLLLFKNKISSVTNLVKKLTVTQKVMNLK